MPSYKLSSTNNDPASSRGGYNRSTYSGSSNHNPYEVSGYDLGPYVYYQDTKHRDKTPMERFYDNPGNKTDKHSCRKEKNSKF